jgi:hypothetical protein
MHQQESLLDDTTVIVRKSGEAVPENVTPIRLPTAAK